MEWSRTHAARRLIPCVIVAAHVLSAAGDSAAGSPQPDFEKLSRHAAEAADFRGAADLLERAMSSAPPERWRDMALRAAGLRLRAGEADLAEQLLAKFDLRYPDHNTAERQILRADVMLAREQFAPASRLYSELTASAGLSKEQMDEVMTRLIVSRLGERKFAEAAESGERLEKMTASQDTEFTARTYRIYALQSAGKLAESEKLLADTGMFRTPARQEVRDKLNLMQLLFSRKISEFKAQYSAFVAGKPFESPDFLSYRLSRSAGELFAAGGQIDAAVGSYRIAFRTAPREIDRKGALLDLANTQMAAGRGSAAAETILKYLQFYPGDANHAKLELQAGRLFAVAGRYREAVSCFGKITADDKLPPGTRLTAAREAALTAEQGGLESEAVGFLTYLIKNAGNASQRQDGHYLLGEHYYRRGDFKRAAESFATAAGESAPLQGKAVFWQLQSLLKTGDYASASPVVERLRKTGDPELTADAEYFHAFLLDKTGKAADAAEAYVKFSADHPESEYAPQAAFDAALLAEKLHQPKIAAGRYAGFAGRFPRHRLAANALFKAMQAAFVARDDAMMRQTSSQLTGDYPSSEYTVSALFLQADFLSGENRLQDALGVLGKIADLVKDSHPDQLAQCYFDQARIYARQSHTGKAIDILKMILEKYVSSATAADAALLSANLHSDRGDYQYAMELYDRAAKLRPGGRFADVCSERIADCEFSRAAETHDLKLFRSAAERYRQLALKNDQETVYSCLYKLGRSREFSGDAHEALAAYGELLYRAVEARKNNRYFDAVWVGKAVYAAALLHLQKASPASAREALRILRTAGQLDLRTGDDFDKMAESIRSRYKI